MSDFNGMPDGIQVHDAGAAVLKRRLLKIVLLCGELVVYSLAWCVAQLVLLLPSRPTKTTRPATSRTPSKTSH